MPFSPKTLSTALMVLALCITLFASTYRLTESPGIWFDEGLYTQTAITLAEQGRQVLQTAPDTFVSARTITGGYPFIYPLSLSYKLFGVGVLQGRAVMVLFILGFFLLSYLLVRRLFGATSAAWTALIVATFPMLYGNGKSVLGEVPGLFFLVASLVALLWLERSGYRNWKRAALFGLVAGLCIVTKPIFVLLLPALLIVFLLRLRTIPLRWDTFVAGFVALLAPLALWLHLQFQNGDTLPQILSFYANPYSEPHVMALVLQNIHRLLTESTPLFTLGLIALWGVSLIFRRREQPTSTELSAFAFCLIILAAYLRLPGWYRYFFPATMVALLFLPYAGVDIFNRLRASVPILNRALWLPYAVLALFALGQLYLLTFSSYVADYYPSHRVEDLSKALSHLPASGSIFVYNIPEVVVLLPTHNFYQFMQAHENDTDAEIIGADQIPLLDTGTVDFIITGKGDYAAHPEQFPKYKLRETANRYAILEKL